ncbi:MAG: S1C family serine protease [Rickettsiaceae bacterium]|nr:S1C family serine protease [Rickettsiaceae bacterium]MDP5082687.1 S1C family serine protease [Rickettsiaceae bacterium]
MFKILRIFALGVFFVLNTTYADNTKIQNIDTIKKAIVTINSRVPVSAYQNTGSWSGTGFIVDSNNGYLVTNNHVVGRASVGTYFVTFHNGQQTEAKLVYYDLYADFAVLKIDPKDFPKEIEVVEFTNEIPKLGSDVFIVGNTEGQGFSFHSGYLSDLYEISGEMPQGSYVINMNSTGGASGSPVLNIDNKAIGVLYGGGKTHSLALKGSYIQHVLGELQSGKLAPNRKHIGVITNLYSLDKAVKHRNFSAKEMDKYIKTLPDARNRVVAVHSVLPGGTAQSILQPGDILWSIEGKTIGADLTILDQTMNTSKSDKVKLTIIRNGKQLEKEIQLYDLTKNKISKMLDFAGGLFFEADDFVAAKSGIEIGSVALANVQTGSSFSSIPEMFVQNYKSVYRIRIKSINGVIINSLDDIIMATNDAINQKYINLEYQNFQPYFPQFGADSGFISAHEHFMQDITFDSIDTKPRVLKFDDNASEWISGAI